MKKVLIISDSSYPSGSAYATRIHSMGLIFKTLGYDVKVLVYLIPDGKPWVQMVDDICSYESIGCDTSIFSQVKNYFRLPNILREIFTSEEISLVFSGACSIEYSRINKACKCFNIPVIVDANEWYHHSIFKFGVIDIRYWLHQASINYGYKKADGIITTSTVFDKHFDGCNTLRIPSVFDVCSFRKTLAVQDRPYIKLIYAGNPGTHKNPKEIFSSLFTGIYKAKQAGLKVQFTIYGADRTTIENNLKPEEVCLLSKLRTEVEFCDKVSRETIMNEYANSDFSVFLRPQRRSSAAGFPTKLVESFIMGTPVITNNTGDIGNYLIDGYNGYLIEDTTDAVYNALIKIDQMDTETRQVLRMNARACAEKAFDYRAYINGIEKLLINGDRNN